MPCPRIHTEPFSEYYDAMSNIFEFNPNPTGSNQHFLPKETLINSANEMKHEAHGTQQPRHINMIGEGVSTAQRSDSLVQLINQHFPNG